MSEDKDMTNMAGKYKEVQARILEINNVALFVPCAAHKLNLIVVHAASITPEMITFVGTVQKLFNFFSSSTIRWEILMKSLKLSLKSSSDTRLFRTYNDYLAIANRET